MMAAGSGHAEVCRLLLEHGAFSNTANDVILDYSRITFLLVLYMYYLTLLFVVLFSG